ncbi:MAG: NAD+ synthase [Mariprofundaceae bacterium]|nr:NAD+ synthase [Mariprofundaceae bacterium]
MKVMLAQCAPCVGDIEGNIAMMLDVMQQAEQAKLDLLVFPELSLTGYPPEDLLLRPSFLDAVEQGVDRLIKASVSVCVIFGAPRRSERGLKNTAFLCQHTASVGIYDKQCLPNYGVFDERRYFEGGQGDNVFEINGQRIGLGICEDMWQAGWRDAQVGKQCDVYVCLNASPFYLGKQDKREALTSVAAKQWQTPVIYVNAVGGQDEVVFDGGSHVVNAHGDLLQRIPLFSNQCVCVDLELSPHIVPDLPNRMNQLHNALVMGLRDYVHRNGCRQVVLGLSGGIDSAVTAVIAVKALGAKHVLGVLLPSEYSSAHSLEDAHALVKNLGIESTVLPIAKGVDCVNGMLSSVFSAWGKSEADVTEENIQARMRGLLLMAISNKTGRMLLTTGNKSEIAVGYATLYGDMSGGFSVLKDVYKTDVFALANDMNRNIEVIPQNSIDKPPSAELRPDQKDSDSLPDYDVLDAILEASIEECLSVDAIAARGFDRNEVVRVVRMVKNNEYKRRQAPPAVKVTRCAFGRDRRYPMTHGFIER